MLVLQEPSKTDSIIHSMMRMIETHSSKQTLTLTEQETLTHTQTTPIHKQELSRKSSLSVPKVDQFSTDWPTD